MPKAEMFAAMGKFNEELINAGIMLTGGGTDAKFSRCSCSVLRL